ncbi:hypothetical protein BDU57DRAFT_242796 [Ampelomyces quisqualis]|uniref:Uncharacterized protein n=1 Tax=Ampelomyces quisqualis TaxID=50730 RepID=A0A6A5QN17_AMPQU|nr:hypothetical protein BDU57DRAFT_242796 [Ampelomyces quisqualis]
MRHHVLPEHFDYVGGFKDLLFSFLSNIYGALCIFTAFVSFGLSYLALPVYSTISVRSRPLEALLLAAAFLFGCFESREPELLSARVLSLLFNSMPSSCRLCCWRVRRFYGA